MIPKCRMSRSAADDPSDDTPNPPEMRPSDSWQKMLKSVRDVDMEKVTDTKEDIDTLLVFAGLFSAVVTTFVVDSYNSLTPNNTDELVFLMRQSLAQNYTLVNGVLRPMAPFPDDLPFETPLWALRVNGLWFASLVISLSTASFGMLVKQWLIEYMAMEWISPEERLRARQYRYAGLKAWRVFEIAAMLPLLLHLSLGLFFVGLCFYTAAANKTIGRSTLPLVLGWAFFALLTVVAPLASPRCPYKITLLKTALRMGRIYVTCRLKKLLAVARGAFVPAVMTLMRTGPAALEMLSDISDRISDSVGRFADCSDNMIWKYFVVFVCSPYLLPFCFLPRRIPSICSSISHMQADVSDEEDYLMHQPYRIHDLLLSVDKVIVNDGPILDNMVVVLKQTQASPLPVTTFVLECIRLRVGEASYARWAPLNANGLIRRLPDLSTLSEGAWAVLVDLMADTLQTHLTDAEKSSWWAMIAVTVIFSWSPQPLPPTARTLLADPALRDSMLQLLTQSITDWPGQDIFDVVGIFLTAHRRSAGRMSYTTWDHLLGLNQPIPHAIQELLIPPLLHSIDPSEYSLTSSNMWAHLMLAFVLHTPLSAFSWPLESYLLRPSYYNGGAVTAVGKVLAALPRDHTDISQRLAAAVRGSWDLLGGALQFYKDASFAKRSLPWRMIHITENGRLEEPVKRDLWSFVVLCADSATSDGEEHYLQTADFVKFCLAFAVPNVPRVFGREDPAGDWRKLVPVLVKAADDGRLIRREDPDDYDTIPKLARRALARLPQDSVDVPQELRSVLERLANMDGRAVRHPRHVEEPTRGGGNRPIIRGHPLTPEEYTPLPLPDAPLLSTSASDPSAVVEEHQHPCASGPSSQGSRGFITQNTPHDRRPSSSLKLSYDAHPESSDGRNQIYCPSEVASLSSNRAAPEENILRPGSASGHGLPVDASSANPSGLPRHIDRAPDGRTIGDGVFDSGSSTGPTDTLADAHLPLRQADEMPLRDHRDVAALFPPVEGIASAAAPPALLVSEYSNCTADAEKPPSIAGPDTMARHEGAQSSSSSIVTPDREEEALAEHQAQGDCGLGSASPALDPAATGQERSGTEASGGV
ncbi:hypothetical protein PsYK624_155030 [Phanerochaete sordida]|uniref:DUF6535 domain-containing protein n=1 Tax=Phanerochaete sordida TaxID=48140 RepID=A0A9P3LL27_9APHY|nr:hypothetical protein PsYK624_155030 [Phanerochaete sordida]